MTMSYFKILYSVVWPMDFHHFYLRWLTMHFKWNEIMPNQIKFCQTKFWSKMLSIMSNGRFVMAITLVSSGVRLINTVTKALKYFSAEKSYIVLRKSKIQIPVHSNSNLILTIILLKITKILTVYTDKSYWPSQISILNVDRSYWILPAG